VGVIHRQARRLSYGLLISGRHEVCPYNYLLNSDSLFHNYTLYATRCTLFYEIATLATLVRNDK